MGVPYDPAIAKGVSPNPIGGGDPRKTACVTFMPIPKPKSIPCHAMSTLERKLKSDGLQKRAHPINEVAT